MARIKIELPPSFSFSASIPVRITDINYGNHVGNDAILALIHEARMQFLGNIGFTEMEFSGVGLIMADAGIEFKNELYYGDIVTISISCQNLSKVSFDLYYRLEKIIPLDHGKDAQQNLNEKKILIAAAKTGMVCYDYKRKKIVAIPNEAIGKLR